MTDKPQRLTAAALLQTEVHQAAPVSDPRPNRSKRGGKVFVQQSQHSKNCLRRRSASNLCGVVRKTSCAIVHGWYINILYALFTLLILTCLISPRQIYNSLYLLPKNLKSLRVDIMFHAALPSLHRFFLLFFCFVFLSFYLNSWYARGENRRISLQQAVRYSKGAGGRPRYATLMLCYVNAMLRYATLCMLKVVAIMRMQG